MATFEAIKDRTVALRNCTEDFGITMSTLAKDREDLARAVQNLLKLADEFAIAGEYVPTTESRYIQGYDAGFRDASKAIRSVIEGSLHV